MAPLEAQGTVPPSQLDSMCQVDAEKPKKAGSCGVWLGRGGWVRPSACAPVWLMTFVSDQIMGYNQVIDQISDRMKEYSH